MARDRLREKGEIRQPPLHDEDNGDKGGNERRVIFDGHPDNLHWVWDTGLQGPKLTHDNGLGSPVRWLSYTFGWPLEAARSSTT